VDKARFYSPYINRFIQPDSIVPNPSNPQSLNRFSYVYNNPVRFNDPTGHMCREDGKGCDGSFLQNTRIGNTILKSSGKKESAGYHKRWLKRHLKDTYDWNVADDFSEDELRKIRETAYDIESYVDGLTDGKGLAWMNKHLGGVSILHGGDERTSSSWPWRHIYLGKTWLSGYKDGGFWNPSQLFAHELGHTWDMSSGNYFGIGGGVGDDLMWAVWGDPRKSLRVFRYEKSGDPAIPPGAYWDRGVNHGYGNGSVNDYAAEAFSWSIYNPNYLPFGSDGVVAMVVNQTIIQQASKIP
jgi:hypothetical protein